MRKTGKIIMENNFAGLVKKAVELGATEAKKSKPQGSVQCEAVRSPDGISAFYLFKNHALTGSYAVSNSNFGAICV